ncbi:MAG: hypothetical protein ACRC62_14605 [Microcoleus sp.]
MSKFQTAIAHHSKQHPTKTQPSIVNCQLLTINCQMSIVNYQLSIINYQLSTCNRRLMRIDADKRR